MPSSHATPLPLPAPDVMFQALDDGAVLFSAQAEVYFGLNHVGARIWELLPPATASVEELCAELASGYPTVDPARLRSDVAELLVELERAGLVVPAGPRAVP